MMNIVQVGANAGNDDAYNYIINNIHNKHKEFQLEAVIKNENIQIIFLFDIVLFVIE